MKNRFKIRIQNRITELEWVNQQVQAFFEAYPQSIRVRHAVQLALDEMITNIIKHGYADRAPHAIDVTIGFQKGMVFIELADDAAPFNPLEAPAADTESNINDRSIGGLGIHLVRNVMDTMQYEYRDNRNILTLKIAGEEP